MSAIAALPGLSPATYQRHALHGDDLQWVEKNCYVDIWIELVHALGLEPAAMMPFTIAIDFEGDQWTFFKPSHDELRALYGIDVQELNVWRPLVEHVVGYLSQGKLVSTEADAFWLPDTQGTDYRRAHTKTTIIAQEIDLDARRLVYFHNASLHALEGEDFVKTFRLDAAPDPAFMPLFAETVRVDRVVSRPAEELREMARALVDKHVERRPRDNPWPRFRARFERDLPEMQARGLDHYHAWAFATVRQAGAAFELASRCLGWIDEAGFAEAAGAFDRVSRASKTFILKAARAVNARRALDASATFDELGAAWEVGMRALARRDA